MEKIVKYSVVIPAFNSSKTIGELCQKISSFFLKNGSSFEIVIVNDGGEIEVWEEALKIFNEQEGKFSIIMLSKNFGQHNATLCGIEHSSGEFIITIDDDLQINPDDIGKLIETQQEESFDLIYGIFNNKKHSTYRNIGSKYIKVSSKYFYKSKGKGSSFRLITREIANQLLKHKANFIYIDEILWWHTDNIAFVEVEHYKRKGSKSTYNAFTLFKMVSNITIHYTNIPLKIMTILGILFSALSFLLGVYFIYRKIYFKVPLGYTSLIVTILFSTSIILLSIGILGQYVFKLYQLQNKKPSYTIKKKLVK